MITFRNMTLIYYQTRYKPLTNVLLKLYNDLKKRQIISILCRFDKCKANKVLIVVDIIWKIKGYNM